MKPHYRLMKLSDCANGTRFYFYRSRKMNPYTLIANSLKRYESIYHAGHDFNIDSKRFRTSLHNLVYAKVD